MRTGLTAIFALAAAGACASAAITPVAGWREPLCAPDAVAVHTPWDDTVRAVFARLRETVARETAGRPGRVLARDVVVVRGPLAPTPGRYAYGWACGGLVVLHVETVRAAMADDEPAPLLARVIAHEIVHILLRHAASDAHPLHHEYDAHLVGAYFMERAGFDCRVWQRRAQQRAARLSEYSPSDRALVEVEARAVALGCDMAKRGQRPLRDVILPAP